MQSILGMRVKSYAPVLPGRREFPDRLPIGRPGLLRGTRRKWCHEAQSPCTVRFDRLLGCAGTGRLADLVSVNARGEVTEYGCETVYRVQEGPFDMFCRWLRL